MESTAMKRAAEMLLIEKYKKKKTEMIESLQLNKDNTAVATLTWEFLKLTVGYVELLERLSEISDTSDFVECGEGLLSHISFSDILESLTPVVPARYGFFALLKRRMRARAAIKRKRDAFLKVIVKLERKALAVEELLIAISGTVVSIAELSRGKRRGENTAPRYPLFHVFSAAKSVLSAKGELSGKKKDEVLSVSDEIKSILEKEGYSLESLGLTPVGEHKNSENHSYTYPN